MEAKRLRELADTLHGKKMPLNSLWQEICDQFYPERADYMIWRPLGTDFAANLMTSYPILCRRDLGNAFGSMLRPTAKQWFHIQRRFNEKSDTATKQYLQIFEETQRRAMYDRQTLFAKAMTAGDHDFASIGQCILSVDMSKDQDHLLFRCWHPKDCAWEENENGEVGFFTRKYKKPAIVFKRLFGNKLHAKVLEAAEKTPFEEFEFYHMRPEVDMYDKKCGPQFKYWSIWYDPMHDVVVEETPIRNKHYIVPRWQTVSSLVYGSQYSFSPATVAALPDARLLQSMMYTLLEAGEKAAMPPIIATQDAVRSDIALYAGGITWVDMEYDEKLGEAIRPLNQDFRGFPLGVELAKDVRGLLTKAFYLDTLNMPQPGPEMTAFEVGQRVQEYIRNALPLFEPMEQEYNAAICNEVFDLLMERGAFGDPNSWPKELRGRQIDFSFESPLHDVIEQQKGDKFLQASKLIGIAVGLDQNAAQVPDAVTALRDALTGVGVPQTWMHSPQAVRERMAQAQRQQQGQTMLNTLEQGSNIVKNIGQVPETAAPPGAGGAAAPELAGA